ncbi:MAG: hemolysin family protein [Treponema sp.]|jgi:putative hemolysin|nr:hemolysin family protein [Treponema sp.]
MVKQLLLQFILILINAFFASAEIALISVNEAKLELLAAAGNKRAGKLLALTRQPARFLATIQVGITLAGFLGSAFAADNFAERLMSRLLTLGLPVSTATLKAASVVVITIILSFFTLVLGELVPKRIAMKKAEPLAFFMSDVIFIISRIFSPVVWFLTMSTNSLLRLFRIDPNAEDPGVTEEEIRMMVDAGSEQGTINAREKEIIHNVFEFDNKTAAEVMTHRLNVTLLKLKDTDGEWETTLLGSGHTYYPVCGDTPDDIIGVLSATDYFRLKDRRRRTVMDLAVKPANFVPESVKTDVLFRNMRRSRNHFAVVLDEYGGMAGIITIHDLMEQLVGDLDDDKAGTSARFLIEKMENRWWRIKGATPLEKVEKALGVSLPVKDYDTFGGYVFSLIGEIPEDGSTAELRDSGLVINVREVMERHLETAIVRLAEENEDSGKPV